jgi:tetrahydromethanopterin S-methyltransferase subunit F
MNGVPPPSPLASESPKVNTKVKTKAEELEEQVNKLSTKVKRLLSDKKTGIEVYDESNMKQLAKIYEEDIKYRSKFYILQGRIESILGEYRLQEEVIKLNEKVIELSQKVNTNLPGGKQAQVYRQSNILKLEELYDIIKKRPALYELRERIQNILAEHKEQTAEITKPYGIGFLKKRKTKKTRKMRKSRKPVKGRK